ncbi:MAG: DUF2057 family protein [Anaerobiospirillum sp.]|nr:DUF2057 family protein [Anaerobiospirillum sp.]
MSKLGALIKVSALAAAVALSAHATAATFKVPINYTVEVVDGKTSDFGYNRFSRTIELAPGRHQLVLLFEGVFGQARDSRIYQAANPIVIEIPNMPADATYTFNYDTPEDERQAEIYSRSQKINLINADTKAPLSQDEANYYLLTSDSGFALLRDYREDLASVGRLYAPAEVKAEIERDRSGANVTAQGVPMVKARSASGFTSAAPAAPAAAPVAAPVMSATVTTAAAQNAAEAQATAQGAPAQVQTIASPANAAIYNQMVQLYEQADDSTKLKIVKYIMSH